MKDAINLDGKVVKVTNATPVKTVNGIHYLHTAEDVAELAAKEADYLTEIADYEANHEYKDNRKKAYGSIQEQLDQIYWDQVNGTTKWKDHVTKVKGDYPRPKA